jgi:hypothetical protein
MAGIGIMIAKKVPPPDKLKGYKPGGASDDGDPVEPDEGDAGADDEEAAGQSMMQEHLDAVKAGDAAEACRTLDAYLEARGFVRR